MTDARSGGGSIAATEGSDVPIDEPGDEPGEAALDLREAALAGALLVVEGEVLFVRFTDGGERPLDDADILLLDDEVTAPASALREAASAVEGPLPLIEAAGLLTSIAAAEAEQVVTVAPEAGGEETVPGAGGAMFRAFTIVSIGGPGGGSISGSGGPLMALPPLENAPGGSHAADADAWIAARLGADFYSVAPVAIADYFTGYQGIGFFTTIQALTGNDRNDAGGSIRFLGADGGVNGDVTVTPEGYVIFRPAAGHTGEASFQYSIADRYGGVSHGQVSVDVVELAPGDLTYETLSWYSAINEAEVHRYEDGSSRLDMYLEVGTVAGAGLTVGGMPFFSAILSGVLQGYVSVDVDALGNATPSGDLIGDLDLLVETSPIFTALGGDVYDALALATGAPAGGGGVPDLGLGQSLTDLVELAVQKLELGDMPAEISRAAYGEANVEAFGNGTFFLDIAGIVSGMATLDDIETPLLDADILGAFGAAAYADIRDGLNVVSDGSLDGPADGEIDIDVTINNIAGAFATEPPLTEEQAIAG